MHDIEILGSTYTQHDTDSSGKTPSMPPGTRVVFCPDRDYGKEGTVLMQKLHYDGAESFFGNVIVKMDGGRLMNVNCWQCKEVGKGKVANVCNKEG